MTKVKERKNKSRNTRSKKQRGGAGTQEEKDKYLLDAIVLGEIDSVEQAIAAGADVNVKEPDQSMSGLMVAVMEENVEIITLLLENGVDVNVQNKNGETALILASMFGYIEIVKLLLENGAVVDTKEALGMTALMVASGEGHLEIVKILLKNGADLNVKDNYNNTALMLASTRRHLEIVELLNKFSSPDLVPKCMSQAEYNNCMDEGNETPQDPISLETVDREDAVKLEGQPKVCYSRKTLNQWFKNSKTNPMTREPVSDDWIRSNMGTQKCEEENTLMSPLPRSRGGKGKGKGKGKTRKPRKTNRSTKNPLYNTRKYKRR